MKKVLSFVLILALVLGSFSFAFGLSDIKDSGNTEAITVANDLGIITGFPDGTFKPDQAVNRAEFAAMITRALAIPETALAAYTSTSFKDTSGYGWAVPYLAFCQSKGIMIGDGYGNVMPGRTISVNEAITMAARAIGYTENSATLVGTWPSNYVTLAQTLGLYDDVNSATTITREAAAQVIYNSLTVTLVTVNSDGQTNPSSKNMLTAGLGAKILDAKIINGTEASKINLKKYLGAYAIAYTKDDKVIAVGEVKSTFLTGEVKTNNEFKADGVTYTNFATTAAVLSQTPAALEFLNGEEDSSTTVITDVAVKDTVTIAVKLSGKKIETIYSISKWDTDNKFKFEDADLDDKTLGGDKFKLDDDKKIDLKSFELIGVNALSDIAEDNVVYVYEGVNTSKITRVEVGTKVVSGLVTAFISADAEFMIDGKGYATAAAVEFAVGDEVKVYLDVNGDIFDSEILKGTTGNYAVLVASKAALGGYGNGEARLFTKDGEQVDKEFAKAEVKTAANLMATGNAVKYALNSDGKISKIVTLAGTTYNAFGEFNKTSTLFNQIVGSTEIGYAMDSKVVVFVNDEGDYSLGSLIDINTEEEITISAMSYDGDGSGKIKVIIVDKKYTSGSDKVYAVVSSVDMALNADGDTVQHIKGLSKGKAYDAWAKDDVAAITKGAQGVVELTVNGSGVITSATGTIPVESVVTGTVIAVSGNMIQVSDSSISLLTWVKLTDDCGIYLYDAVDAVWVTKNINYLKGKYVDVLRTDDNDGKTVDYDLVIL